MVADLLVLQGLAATNYSDWLGSEAVAVACTGNESSSNPWDYRPKLDSFAAEFLHAEQAAQMPSNPRFSCGVWKL